MPKIMVLDDDLELRDEIEEYLVAQGRRVTGAGCIREFRQMYARQGGDILIIDRMLPDGDGAELARELRQAGQRCGIVLFTALDGSDQRIAGYALGADHYLCKPVRLEELSAVVHALAWRLQFAPEWKLHTVNGQLHTPHGDILRLTTQESMFLDILVDHPGKPVRRRTIVDALGKSFSSYNPRNLDALVKRLRNKVDADGQAPLPIRTVHGVGYLLTAPMARIAS